MTQQPGHDLDELRDAVATQLSGWRTVVSGDAFGFTHARDRHGAATIERRSCLRLDSSLVAEIGRRRADNDGTFDRSGPVHMVTLVLASDPAAASGETDTIVDYREATAQCSSASNGPVLPVGESEPSWSPLGPVVVDEDGRRVETVYENPRFPRFYHSNR